MTGIITIRTFGYKYGRPPAEAAVMDCRQIRNPHHVLALRPLDGRDKAVQDYVRADREYRVLETLALVEVGHLLADGGTLHCGCYGGRHRSVALAEILAKGLRGMGVPVVVKHTRL